MNTASVPNRTRALRIFLVENHLDTLAYLQACLENDGHTVQTASTMHAALAKLAKAECDVLIADIGLPDGDGWELLRRARLAERVFTVAMTGFGTNSASRRSREAGYRHHLLKPFKPAELHTLLEGVIAERPGL